MHRESTEQIFTLRGDFLETYNWSMDAGLIKGRGKGRHSCFVRGKEVLNFSIQK